MNQRGFSTISAGIIVAIVLIGVAGYLVLSQNSEVAEQNLPTKEKTASKQEATDETEHTQFNWVRAAFPSGYKHAVEIWHPDNWVFNCCGDKDTESNHFIYLPNSSTRIVITDYALVEGGFGNLTSITPKKKIEALRQLLLTNAQELTRKTIQGLETEVYVYQALGGDQQHPLYPGPDRGIQPSREIYLINTGDDVIAVIFENYEQFDEGFINEFLNRLELGLR